MTSFEVQERGPEEHQTDPFSRFGFSFYGSCFEIITSSFMMQLPLHLGLPLGALVRVRGGSCDVSALRRFHAFCAGGAGPEFAEEDGVKTRTAANP